MKLRITRSTKNKVVTLEIATVEFTTKEHQMLDQIGEPVIDFNKLYGNNVIKFSKKIRSNFKVRVKFDANLESDTDTTADYIEAFIEDLKDMLSEAMEQVADQYSDFLIPAKQLINIEY